LRKKRTKCSQARPQRFMTVIIVTWEAEIRRIGEADIRRIVV
jgi:hypothetical protein